MLWLFLIASACFWAIVLFDPITSERLDGRPGARETNTAFADAHGGHSVARRLTWAAVWQGLTVVGFVVQTHGAPVIGAIGWVAALLYPGVNGLRAAIGNARRLG